MEKTLSQMARELGVSLSYLCQVKSGRRPPSAKLCENFIRLYGIEFKQPLKQHNGGSVWESNPPKTLLVPRNGFEVREAHRDSNAPPKWYCRLSQ